MGATTEAVTWGAGHRRGGRRARQLRRHHRLRRRRPRRRPSRRAGGRRHRRAHRIGGNRPDVILVPASYDGRDIAGRLSARLDRPVITNVVGLRVDGDDVRSQHGLFGGAQVATARFTGERPWIFVVRAKSFAAEPAGGGAPQVAAGPGPRARRHQRRQGPRPPRRGAHRAQARRGRGRGVRRPGPRRRRALRHDRGAGQAAAGGGRRQPRHRRRRLGALLAPGRPDGQDREAHRLHRRAASRVPPSTWWA